MTAVELKLAPGSIIAEARAGKAASGELVKLPTARYPRPAAMADATVKLLPTAQLPAELGLPEQPGAASIAKILFFLFLAVVVVLLIMGIFVKKKVM